MNHFGQLKSDLFNGHDFYISFVYFRLMSGNELAHLLAQEARAEGFPLVGAVDIDLARPQLEGHVARYDEWLAAGHSGTMEYLVRGRDRRADPRVVFPEAQSVLCVAIPYDPRPVGQERGPRYARYLREGDYHEHIADRLERALQRASARDPFKWKICVDTSAVLERSWAALAGLGWIGKNTLLIHPQHGSYLFLGEALIDRKLGAAPAPIADLCGHCTRCLEGCPTGALSQPRWLESKKCISYWTLEEKSDRALAPELRAQAGTWVAGCDLCQEVCPFNRKAVARATEVEPEYPALLTDWARLIAETPEQYKERVKGSSLKRVKPLHFSRNVAVAFGNAIREAGTEERADLFAKTKIALERRISSEEDNELRTLFSDALDGLSPRT